MLSYSASGIALAAASTSGANPSITWFPAATDSGIKLARMGVSSARGHPENVLTAASGKGRCEQHNRVVSMAQAHAGRL